MKKTIALITILTILAISLFTGYTYAAVLDDFAISVDKKTVHPEEQVVLTVSFGQQLGSYTVKVDFDNDIFDYVSAEGGTGSVQDDIVTVQYTELSSTRENMSVTFKAKKDIKTSNPTEFSVTASNLKSEGGSTGYDEITSGKVETITVEPIYQDYTLALEHTGDIIKGQETDFTLSYSSPMGRPYAKARLEGEVTKAPENATVKLIGTDEKSTKYDILDDGWGDPQGYEIGGEDVSQELKLKGTFSEVGEYTITLKLVDRASSDTTIVEKTFNFTVKEAAAEPEPEPEPQVPGTTETPGEQTPEASQPTEELPPELPKTGINEYLSVIVVFVVAGISFAYINKKQKNV